MYPELVSLGTRPPRWDRRRRSGTRYTGPQPGFPPAHQVTCWGVRVVPSLSTTPLMMLTTKRSSGLVSPAATSWV